MLLRGFAACGVSFLLAAASPFAGKVKKGEHTFAVTATDAADNADASPATAIWKVKRKKAKR